MPANTVPVFTNVPVIGAGSTSITASPGLGGTGGVAPAAPTTILAGGAFGSRIEEIVVVPSGTTGTVFASTLVNLFLFDGTSYHLEDQVLVPGFTVAVNTIAPFWRKVYSNLVLPTTWSLVAAQQATQAAGAFFTVTAKGGNF
jgi:hypothetical protein